MNLSIWLLAASCAAGGPVDAPAYAPSASLQPQAVSSAPCNCGSSTTNSAPAPHRSGILSGLRERIHNRFHSDEDTNVVPAGGVIYQQAPAPMPARIMPRPAAPTTAEPPSVSALQPVSATKLDLPPVQKEFQNKIGAAEDYTWITGQLSYVHADGGCWVLRYAGPDQEDKYGGSVVLKPTTDMKNFREGDLVSVNGDVLNDGRASKRLGGPLYRVTSINMIERAD